VSACGIALLGAHEDLAEARVNFANGCIANFKASRVSLDATRRMSIFSTTSMADVDFSKNEVRVIKPSLDILDREVHLDQLSAQDRAAAKASIFGELFTVETLPAEPRNAILDEQNDFALSIRTHAAPIVTGEDATAALRLAAQILEQIAQHRWEGESSRPWQIGPTAAPAPKILPMPQPGERRPNRKAG
jgi:predicted dehydrogenase